MEILNYNTIKYTILNKTTKAKALSGKIKSKEWKIVLAGLAFAFLWASASTATKIGLNSAQPFVISIFRRKKELATK